MNVLRSVRNMLGDGVSTITFCDSVEIVSESPESLPFIAL